MSGLRKGKRIIEQPKGNLSLKTVLIMTQFVSMHNNVLRN